MRRSRLLLAPLACLITLGLAASAARAETQIGQPAPPFAAPELGGGTFDLAGERGKVVIVNFWATWCGPCKQEMPALDAFYRRHHGEGLDLVGVSADRSRDRDDVAKMMQSFAYPAAMMGDATVNGFGRPRGIPVTYVIAADGTLRAKFSPDETGVTEKQLDAVVLPLLSEVPHGK